MKRKTHEKPKESQGICFTVMPFGGYFDSYYLGIYEPAIRAAGLEAKRVDDLSRPSNIVGDIWKYTKNAKLILADLTGQNPNVFYELGLAHAITKPAIMIAQSIDDIPYDLRSLRIILYDKNAFDWGNTLKKNVTKAIKEVLASPEEAISPIFMEQKGITKATVTVDAKEFSLLKHQLDLLKKDAITRSSREYSNNRILSTFQSHSFRLQPTQWNRDQVFEFINESIRLGVSREEIFDHLTNVCLLRKEYANELLDNHVVDDGI